MCANWFKLDEMIDMLGGYDKLSIELAVRRYRLSDVLKTHRSYVVVSFGTSRVAKTGGVH